MTQTLVYVGIACIIAAIVGGGFKGLGIEIPFVATRERQVVLAIVGLLLLGSAGAAFYLQRPRLDVVEVRRSGLEAYDAHDFVTAIKRFRIAAEGGDVEAKYHYGEMLWHGEGTRPDPARGVEVIQASAESGFAPAQASLAAAYLEGDAVEKDLDKARYWATLGAAQDDPDGSFILGHLATEPREKEKHYRATASEGHVVAQERLASLYLMKFVNQANRYSEATKRGVGGISRPLKSDALEAVRWAGQATQRGSSLAACLAGWAFEETGQFEDAYRCNLICRQHSRSAETISRMEAALERLELQLEDASIERAAKAARAFTLEPIGTIRHGHTDWRTVPPIAPVEGEVEEGLP